MVYKAILYCMEPNSPTFFTQLSGIAWLTEPSVFTWLTEPSGSTLLTELSGSKRLTEPSGSTWLTEPSDSTWLTEPRGSTWLIEPNCTTRLTEPSSRTLLTERVACWIVWVPPYQQNVPSHFNQSGNHGAKQRLAQNCISPHFLVIPTLDPNPSGGMKRVTLETSRSPSKSSTSQRRHTLPRTLR